MGSRPHEVAIAMPPVAAEGVGSDKCREARPPSRRRDTFGPSGMPITVKVFATGYARQMFVVHILHQQVLCHPGLSCDRPRHMWPDRALYKLNVLEETLSRSMFDSSSLDA